MTRPAFDDLVDQARTDIAREMLIESGDLPRPPEVSPITVIEDYRLPRGVAFIVGGPLHIAPDGRIEPADGRHVIKIEFDDSP